MIKITNSLFTISLLVYAFGTSKIIHYMHHMVAEAFLCHDFAKHGLKEQTDY